MNKKEALRFHKLAVLSNSLITELDELKPTAGYGKNLQEKTKAFIEALEPFLESAFDSEMIKSSTYLTDMCNKIDTIIRKNYEHITK